MMISHSLRSASHPYVPRRAIRYHSQRPDDEARPDIPYVFSCFSMKVRRVQLPQFSMRGRDDRNVEEWIEIVYLLVVFEEVNF